MIEIPVRVCGDHWLNPQEVQEKLDLAPKDSLVMIDMSTEGASMTALGILALLDNWCRSTGRDHQSIMIRAWPNAVDVVPYKRTEPYLYSHFFWMAQRYWDQPVGPSTHEYLFGAFFGRRTLPRMRIMWDLRQRYPQWCLLGLMRGGQNSAQIGHDLEHNGEWDLDVNWIKNPGIDSMDDHVLGNQYDPAYNTNADLLKQYHRFDIEIVNEAYCRGYTYFPTEKTVRPMIGRKPMLVFGPSNFLARLREQGFQTWNHVWDESYDVLEGRARWNAMLNVIADIVARPRMDLLEQCQSVCDHNHNWVRHLGTDKAPR